MLMTNMHMGTISPQTPTYQEDYRLFLFQILQKQEGQRRGALFGILLSGSRSGIVNFFDPNQSDCKSQSSSTKLFQTSWIYLVST